MSILIYYFNENIYVIYFFKNTSEVRLKKEIGFPKKKKEEIEVRTMELNTYIFYLQNSEKQA